MLKNPYSLFLAILYFSIVIIFFPFSGFCQDFDNQSNDDNSSIHKMAGDADALLKSRKIAEGVSLIDSILAIARENLASDDTTLAYVLNVAGKAAYFKSDYNSCGNAWRESYEIRNKALGKNHSLTAASLNNLGALAKTLGEFGKAESLYTEVLNIRKVIQPENHPDFAALYNNLGSLMRITGRFAEAESYYRRAYDLNYKSLGDSHPATAGCMNNMAVLYEEQGRYELAKKYYNDALIARSNALGKVHPQTAASINNLGNLYYNTKNYIIAESLYTEALSIRKEIYGDDHIALTSTYNNLATIFMVTGNYDKATELYKKSLEIKSKKLPPDHPLLASSYDNLGLVYYYQGMYAEALRYFNLSQPMYIKAYGELHPYTTSSKVNIASLYAATGEYDNALSAYRDVLESRLSFIHDVFIYASEANKLKYLNKYPLIDNRLLSLANKLQSPEVIELAFMMVLESKAMVIDAICEEKQVMYLDDDRDSKSHFEKWRSVCGELSTLSLSGADVLRPGIFKSRLDSLYTLKDSLEVLFSGNFAGIRKPTLDMKARVEQLASKLDSESALWEFVKYAPYDFDRSGNDNQRTGKQKYLAFALNNNGKLKLLELGNAEAIDNSVSEIRESIQNADQLIYSFGELTAEEMLKEQTRALYEIVVEPLWDSRSNLNAVYLSPDDALNLVPFEILNDNYNNYLVESLNIRYVSSSRDLLEFVSYQKDRGSVFILADPDYSCAHTDNPNTGIRPEGDLKSVNRGNTFARYCGIGDFPQLPSTKIEADEISSLFKANQNIKVDYLIGQSAGEGALKTYEDSPMVLHLATHGYFCELDQNDEVSLIENPLLRSGLAFSNANCFNRMSPEQIQALEDDGILTAFEASGLDLNGTSLVTLSACETGVGEVKSGEGVFGLRRAFQYAGAEAILMSLWKVDEVETSNIMIDFYKNWLDGKPKGEAFRIALLTAINNRLDAHGCAHPYFWGGFIIFGNPY